MRIAMIAETFTTGVGRHTADLVTELCGKGHEVHLLYGSHRHDPALVAEVGLLPLARVKAVAMRRAPSFSDVRSWWALWAYLRKNGPFDAIHGHSSKGGALARLLAPALKARCLYTPHAFVTLASDLHWGTKFLYRLIECFLARLTDTVICCSAKEYAHATALGLGKHRCVVVPNGIKDFQAEPLEVRDKIGLPHDVCLAGFIGRLESQKGPDLLIDAIVSLHRRAVPIHFAIVGEGALRPVLEQRLTETGAQSLVTWLGAVDGRRLMMDLDLLAMPSRYEGFPYVLLEALHCGVPVVATPVGGVAETNADGKCGLMVPHDDPEALANGIERLVRDPEMRKSMSLHAQNHAARFSVAAMADQIEVLYRGPSTALPIGT